MFQWKQPFLVFDSVILCDGSDFLLRARVTVSGRAITEQSNWVRQPWPRSNRQLRSGRKRVIFQATYSHSYPSCLPILFLVTMTYLVTMTFLVTMTSNYDSHIYKKFGRFFGRRSWTMRLLSRRKINYRTKRNQKFPRCARSFHAVHYKGPIFYLYRAWNLSSPGAPRRWPGCS